MKLTSLLLALGLAFSSAAFAANEEEGEGLSEHDKTYSCVGRDAVANKGVSFSIEYFKYENGVHKSQQIVFDTEYGEDGSEVPQPNYQMYGVTRQNLCTATVNNEYYVNPSSLSLQPGAKTDVAPLRVSFKADCKDAKVDIKGVCFGDN